MKFEKIAVWTVASILGLYILLVIYRVPFVLEKQKTDEAVAKIHATKLTLDDVMGKNLPPVPDQKLNDSTIAGIDANNNGIRDDIEIAIFKKYPDSAKIRAALLQYAMALQMEMTQKIINAESVTAVAEETSRGFDCVGSTVQRGDGDYEILVSYIDFVKNIQNNTNSRKEHQKNFYKQLGSYTLPSGCDIELSKLPV